MEPSWKKLVKENPTNKVDFQVRVHVLEARELQPKGRNGMSDPMCVVNSLGKKESTIVHKNTTICTWDHLIFYEYSMLPQEFFSGKIKLSVFDANTILRNVEIGSFEMETSYVYEAEGHELYRRWVALVDSTSTSSGVQGYLKISVTVLGPGDKAPAHEEIEEFDEENESEDLQSMVLMPPTVVTQLHRFEFLFYKGEGLPKMDTIGKCDAFAAIKFGGNAEISTEIQKGTFSPVWNEKLVVPVSLPTMSETIPIEFRDWDRGSADEIISTIWIPVEEVLSGKWNEPRWVHLTGTPPGTTEIGIGKLAKLARKMNKGFLEGSSPRGRILMAVKSAADPTAKLGKERLSGSNPPSLVPHVLRFDLWEASQLPTTKDVSVEVVVGEFSVESKKTKVKNGSASWYKSIDELALQLPKDTSQHPDLFLNFYSHSLTKKKRIGYIRIPAKDLKGEVEWGMVKGDIFASKGKPTPMGGFCQFKIVLAGKDSAGKRVPLERPPMTQYQLRAYIYQGRNLIACDADGASDPFVLVNLGKGSAVTQTIKGTTFPLFYECLQLDVELPTDLSTAPDIHVTVWDWDQIGANDFMGRFRVPVGKLSPKFPEVPKWYPIYIHSPDMPEGEILASFQLIPSNLLEKYTAPPSIKPKFRDCIVEISAIGLRGMLPFRLFKMSKPFIEFNCGGEVKVTTKPSSSPNGTSPNHLEVLQLQVKIPEDKLYTIPLNIKVYDDRILGKTLVATRSINLTPYLPWTDDKLTLSNLREDYREDVTTIPGAELIKEKAEVEDKGEVIVDIPEDDDMSKSLLAAEGDMAHIRENLIASLDQRDIPEVAECFLEGAEEEKEEPQEEENVRKVLKKELESELADPTFGVFSVFRARHEKGKLQTYEVGKFKGKIRVIEKSQSSQAAPPLNLLQLFSPTDYIVRAYILEGYQLVPKDRDGQNNPYVTISNGTTKIKDVDQRKQQTSRPQFYKCYELRCTFPNETLLSIKIVDYDHVGPHELIGATKVDLEDRFFNDKWKNYSKKPMEYRCLWHPSSSNPQGQIKMWVDILTVDEAKKSPAENITPPTPIEFEMRVIIWEAKDVIFKDKNMSDIFVSGYPAGQKPQLTDTHWRSEDGIGLFNWRMKFPIKIPCKNPQFKLQIWDKDVLSPNDAIGEANINMRTFYARAAKNTSGREDLSRQWITMSHPNHDGVSGQLLVSFEILSLEEASKRPVGFGRSEPNDHPFLDVPKRPETSFSPLRVDKFASKVIIGQNKGKIMIAVGVIIVILILVIILLFSIIF